MKKIKVDPLTLICLAFMLFSNPSFALPMLLAILVHEMGHIVAAIALRVRIKRLHLSIVGARLEIDGSISYLEEFLLSLAGPLFGILGATLVAALAIKNESAATFAIVSLLLSAFNFFPISTFDGGRMAKCLFCSIFPLDFAQKILSVISFFTMFLFWMITVYFMIKFAGGLSAFVFCSIFFIKHFIFDVDK